MPKTFTPCGDDVIELAQTVMYASHPRLIDAGVTIEYLFATDLEFHGYPAVAVIKIMSLENRTAGSKDARMLIDESWWEDATDDEKRAALDHEFTHLLPQFKKKKKPKKGESADLEALDEYKTDDIGRPVLKMRKHCFQMGGFYEVIERNQENAVELQNIIVVNKQLRERNLIQKNLWG